MKETGTGSKQARAGERNSDGSNCCLGCEESGLTRSL